MKHSIPRSPFATRLSGSVKETELRIRNIFQGPKKRPPVPIMILTALLIFSCGWLVSCQPREERPPDSSSASGASDLSAKEQVLLELLYQSAAEQIAFDDRVPVGKELLATLEGDVHTLGAAAFTDHFGTSLCVGVMDDRNETLASSTYFMAWQGGAPHVVTFEWDGSSCLLYTNNGAHQGYTYGDAGLIRFDGTDITWLWPVEGDIRDETSRARADYDAYWEDHLALLSPGGVEIFVENKDYGPYEGSPVQWTPESSQLFYSAPEADLPAGTLEYVRKWLEEFTRDERNPWDAVNTSALWRVTTLSQAENSFPSQKEGELSLVVECQADSNDALCFSAALLYDPTQGQVSQVVDWTLGTWEESPSGSSSAEDQVPEDSSTLSSGIDSPEFYTLLHQYYRETYQGQTCYFGVDTPDVPQEGDLRLGPVAYAGSCRLDETIGAAYTVDVSRYHSGQWDDGYTDFLVLTRGADGSFQSVLGEPSFNTDGMAVEDIIRQVAWHLMDLDVCLWRDGWPTPVGPGNWTDLFNYAYEGEPTVETLEGWDPIYWPGDYWDRWSLEGITALRYYIAAEDRWSAYTINVTRSDLYTPRGIRVGSSRDEVLEAYPGLFDTPYWHDTAPDFPKGDYLWYCDNEEGWGAAILFFFEGDTVRQIRLNNMFD